jgi:hypothetical protein
MGGVLGMELGMHLYVDACSDESTEFEFNVQSIYVSKSIGVASVCVCAQVCDFMSLCRSTGGGGAGGSVSVPGLSAGLSSFVRRIVLLLMYVVAFVVSGIEHNWLCDSCVRQYHLPPPPPNHPHQPHPRTSFARSPIMQSTERSLPRTVKGMCATMTQIKPSMQQSPTREAEVQ